MQNLEDGPFGPGQTGRPVRRPGAGRRAPDRRDPAAERRRHRPADNPFFRGRAVASARRGRRRTSRRSFAYGVRNSFGMAFDPFSGDPLGAGERRRLVRRDQPGRGRDERRLGAGHGAGRPGGASSRRSRRARSSSATSACSSPLLARRTSPTPRQEALRDLFMLPARTTATPSSAGSSRSPGRDRVPGRPRPRPPVPGDLFVGGSRDVPRGRLPVPVRPDAATAAAVAFADPRLRGRGGGQRQQVRRSPRARACCSAGLRRRHRHPDRPEREPLRRVALQRRRVRDPAGQLAPARDALPNRLGPPQHGGGPGPRGGSPT